MMEIKPPSRGDLLELCKAAGLKATGWKKERMVEELAKLDGHPTPGSPDVPEADEPAEPAPADEDQPPPVQRQIRSGWCIANQHADGRPMRWGNPCRTKDCPCWCHMAPDSKNEHDHRVVPKAAFVPDVET